MKSLSLQLCTQDFKGESPDNRGWGEGDVQRVALFLFIQFRSTLQHSVTSRTSLYVLKLHGLHLQHIHDIPCRKMFCRGISQNQFYQHKLCFPVKRLSSTKCIPLGWSLPSQLQTSSPVECSLGQNMKH